MDTPTTRIAEIIPASILQKPFGEEAFHNAARRFIFASAPIFAAIAISFILAGITWEYYWFVGATFFALGLGLGCVLIIFYQSYRDTVNDYQKQRKTHDGVVNEVLVLVKSITINQVNVARGGVVNNNYGVPLGTNEDGLIPVGTSLPLLNDPMGERFELGLQIARIGLRAWDEAKGKRPTPKPISAEAMTKQFNIGRDKWTEVMQFLEDARVFSEPLKNTWRPLCATPQEVETKLNDYMAHLGYTKYTNLKGQRTWILRST